ncbi:MAG: nucleotidyltransferase domain-containing protein [Actinomycetota bacterium]|nr:nucleotidyltransferase domain-containing protein [Actinomycetota bacterium]
MLRELRRYAEEEIAARPEVRDAVLIGSLARGDWSARSDADLVLVVDDASEPGPFRGSEYRPRQPVGVDVDIFVYTAEEARHLRPRMRDEIERGLTLYTRE